METLKTLSDEVLSWLDESGNTASTRANARNAVKQAHVERLEEYNWPFMLYGQQSFELVAGQTRYTLHSEFNKPRYFKNLTTNQWLRDVPERNITTAAPDPQKATLGIEFVYAGRSPVKNQPSSASVLTIVSSSASDVGATKGIVVRGETADGVTTDQLNPNGLGSVTGLIQFTRILQVTKLSVWAGTLTMTSNAGTVTNLTLFPSELGREHQQIELLWTPSGVQTIIYDFYRQPNPLDFDNSIPDIPEPFKKILVWDALLAVSAYDGTVDGSRLRVWEANQQKFETGLYAAHGNQGSIGGQGRRVRLLDESLGEIN